MAQEFGWPLGSFPLMLLTSWPTRSVQETFYSLLAQLLHLAPSLETLFLEENHLCDLLSSLIKTLLSHPTLKNLDMSQNGGLLCAFDPSGPCALESFLSQVLLAASSSSLRLQLLWLGHGHMSAQGLYPLLEEILALGSKGLQTLRIDYNPLHISQGESLARIVSKKNQFIKHMDLFDPKSVQRQLPLLNSALKRNNRLQSDTHHASFETLQSARVILHGSPATSPPSSRPALSRPAGRYPLPDLLSSLLPTIFSFLSPGALSKCRSTLSFATPPIGPISNESLRNGGLSK